MKAPQGKEVYGFRWVKGMAFLLGHRLLEKAVLWKQDCDKRCFFYCAMLCIVRRGLQSGLMLQEYHVPL